jgi:hypothetical protein
MMEENKKNIDSISLALNTEHGFNMKTGQLINANSNLPVESKDTFIVEDSDNIETEDIEEVVEDNYYINDEHREDEEYAKENMRELIRKGMDIADDMLEIVRISDSPKAFEPASLFLKTIVELNEKLIDIHERKRKIKNGAPNKKKEESQVITQNIQQNNISCSPLDLLQTVKDLNNKDK